MESTNSPSYTQATGLVFIRQAEYNTTYSITLNANDHAETKEEFTTPIIGSGASSNAPSNKSVCDGLRDLINNDSVLGPEYTATTVDDYLLKIVASSIEDYDNFQQKFIGELEFTKMSSSISLQEMKNSHNLPLKQLENF